MKTIGIIGGMSWESTAVYYRLMNEAVRKKLGGLHSARTLVWSFDFDAIAAMQTAGDWQGAAAALTHAGKALQAAGADCLVLATNTMHKVAESIEVGVNIPFLHIADVTADAIKAMGLKKVGLLATRFTMEEDFYTARMLQRHGIETLVPDAEMRSEIHRIIYDELCQGVIHEASKQCYFQAIADLVARGAQGIILGCTEIGMLIKPADISAPIFDSTHLHAEAAVAWAIAP